MQRKPVVLITVEGGVVQNVEAPDTVIATVHDYDNIKVGGDITCVWCGHDQHIEALEGSHKNICQECKNPTLSEQFFEIALDEEFLCLNGGRWKRTSGTTATCMETDSAFKAGNEVDFRHNATVFRF